jgi:glyoxylate/hydroxypyruvate reductase A
MKLLLHLPGGHHPAWRDAFARALAGASIAVWPERTGRADYVVAWKPPAELFQEQPAPRAIFNLGAGVDALLATPSLPPAVPIFRLEDAGMAEQMAEYITWMVLGAYREFDAYAQRQRAGDWAPRRRQAKADFGVGLLGCGVLGRAVASALRPFGFPLAGFSRSAKPTPGVTAYAGAAEFDGFLACARVLVCLLPATAETRNLVDARALAKLPAGAALVNVGRGSVVVEADLLAALDSGHLAHATLDVFRDEPLPPDHRFWHHPRVTVTPHVAAVTRIDASVAQVADKIRRFERGLPVTGAVDRQRGY